MGADDFAFPMSPTVGTVQNNGTAMAQRSILNFVGLTLADDAANNRTTVTYSAPGASTLNTAYTAGSTVADETLNLTVGKGPLTLAYPAIAAAQTAAMSIQNVTAAANNAQQYSPMLTLQGNGWDSTASASKSSNISFQVTPVQTAGTPPAYLSLWKSYNGAAVQEALRISDYGGYGGLGSAATAPNGFSFLTTVGGILATGYGIAFNGNANTFDIFVGSQIGGGVPDFEFSYSSVRTFIPSPTDSATCGAAANAWKYNWSNLFANGAVGSVLTVAANTIAPLRSVHHCGAGLIKTITVPVASFIGTITIIPDAAYTYDATGNIVVPAGGGTATTNKAMTFTFDGTKWTPSY